MKQVSRRSFISNSSKVAVATVPLAATVLLPVENEQQKEMKNIFVHHVYFWLREGGTEQDLEKLVAGLKKLSAVRTIKQFHLGKPAATSREVIDGSYVVSWLTIFDNKEDQDSYQTDPIHLQFVKECSPFWKKVVVYDSIDF